MSNDTAVFTVFDIFVVVTELLLPSEVIDGEYLISLQFLDDITSVHISCDKSDHDATVKIGEVGSDVISQLFNLLIVTVPPSLEGKSVLIHAANSFFGVVAPLNLSNSSDNLTWVL